MAKRREWTIRKVETGIFRCPGAEIDYLRVHAVYRRRGCSVCNGRRPAVGRYNGTPLRPVRRLLVRMRYPKCIGIVECFADELHRHRQTGPAEPAADHDGRITSDRKRHAAMRVRPFRQTWIQPGAGPAPGVTSTSQSASTVFRFGLAGLADGFLGRNRPKQYSCFGSILFLLESRRALHMASLRFVFLKGETMHKTKSCCGFPSYRSLFALSLSTQGGTTK